MTDVLLFARLLRDAGLSVAPSEIAEAIAGLAVLVQAYQRDLHYRVLLATLVKRVEDQAVFDSVYKLYFGELGPLSSPGPKTPPVRSSNQGLKSAGLSTLAMALLNGDFAPCQYALRESVVKLCQRGQGVEESVRRVLVNLDYFGVLNSLRLAKQRGVLEEWEYLAAQENATKLTRQVHEAVLKSLLDQGTEWSEITRNLNWREKSFSLLSSTETVLVKSYLDKIGKKLAVRPGLQPKPAPTGALDLRRTLRNAMSRGGGVWELLYGRKVPTKPDLILMCDVSNSVYRFTGFMLQLVAAFRQRFNRVRAFLFVDTLWEVPDDFFQTDIHQALADIRENNRCSISGLSDFGQVFCKFTAEVLPELNPRSTLLILGDARNNWRPTELSVFKQISSGLRRVYWLNPLPAHEWGQEDCQLRLYSPFCTGVFECGSLVQLEQVAAKIL